MPRVVRVMILRKQTTGSLWKILLGIIILSLHYFLDASILKLLHAPVPKIICILLKVL